MAHHLLHHQREIENIREIYDSDRSLLPEYDRERSYHRSYPSHSCNEKSHPTPHTPYTSTSSKRPPQIHHNTSRSIDHDPHRYFQDRYPQESPSASVVTYASTVLSEEDVPEELPKYAVPEYQARPSPYEPTAVASTPSDFSELFPSHRRLAVHHDDATLDGNMNLRVDTEVKMHGGRRCDMTLFHLRMHDLKDREFSLRRYCRDSGREICHSTRKQHKLPSQKRPGFQRSLSNAFSSMRSKSDQRSPTMSSLKRNDSGYGSAHSSLDIEREDRPHSAHATTKSQQPVDSECVKLEFSNYAQIDIKRTGTKGCKRYEFEYWGVNYAWRRVVRKDARSKDISYHLTKSGNDQVLAYVIPSPLTPTQAEEERSRGGWVPPCSMWIADDSIVRGQKDVADVIVASGLFALVDDAIRARFLSKHSQQLFIPKLGGLEYVGPKRLINEMFRRESSGQHSRRSSSSSQNPLKARSLAAAVRQS